MNNSAELEGTWLGFEKGGPAGDWNFVVSGNHFEGTGGFPEESFKGKFITREVSDSNQIDLTIEGGFSNMYNRKTALGIYKLEGDILTVSANEPGAATRPSSFHRSRETRVIVFKRRRASGDEKVVARVMEDLLDLRDREIQLLLREVREGDLKVALTDAGPEVREKVLRNINDTLRAFFEAEIKALRPQPPQKVQGAQQRILWLASDLKKLGSDLADLDEGQWEDRLRQKIRDRLEATPVSRMELGDIKDLFGDLATLGLPKGIELWDEVLPKDELNEKLLVLGLHMTAQNLEPELVMDVLETRTRTYLQQQETRCQMIVAGIKALQAGHVPHVVRLKLASFNPTTPKAEESREYLPVVLREESAALLPTLRELAKGSLGELTSEDIDQLLVGFAQMGKKDGILTLEIFIPHMTDEFLKAGIQMLTDGLEPERIRAVLEEWMQSLPHEHETAYRKVVEGVVALQQGTHPDVIEAKLRAIS